jgi:hypothetical protein
LESAQGINKIDPKYISLVKWKFRACKKGASLFPSAFSFWDFKILNDLKFSRFKVWSFNLEKV